MSRCPGIEHQDMSSSCTIFTLESKLKSEFFIQNSKITFSRRVFSCRSITLDFLLFILEHKAILFAMIDLSTFPISIIICLFLAFAFGNLWFLPLVSTSGSLFIIYHHVDGCIERLGLSPLNFQVLLNLLHLKMLSEFRESNLLLLCLRACLTSLQLFGTLSMYKKLCKFYPL